MIRTVMAGAGVEESRIRTARGRLAANADVIAVNVRRIATGV
jgi:hypothetical protein